MEQIIEFGKKISKIETKLENVEKKVDTLETKVETNHTQTEQQIGSLVVCVKEFIATQSKTNEINEKLLDEFKTSREKQETKLDAKIDKMENKYDGEIKNLRETMLKDKYELQLGDKEQDLSYQKDKVHISGKLIAGIIGGICTCLGLGIAFAELFIK